jgi:hypothetical protein
VDLEHSHKLVAFELVHLSAADEGEMHT